MVKQDIVELFVMRQFAYNIEYVFLHHALFFLSDVNNCR